MILCYMMPYGVGHHNKKKKLLINFAKDIHMSFVYCDLTS